MTKIYGTLTRNMSFFRCKYCSMLEEHISQTASNTFVQVKRREKFPPIHEQCFVCWNRAEQQQWLCFLTRTDDFPCQSFSIPTVHFVFPVYMYLFLFVHCVQMKISNEKANFSLQLDGNGKMCLCISCTWWVCCRQRLSTKTTSIASQQHARDSWFSLISTIFCRSLWLSKYVYGFVVNFSCLCVYCALCVNSSVFVRHVCVSVGHRNLLLSIFPFFSPLFHTRNLYTKSLSHCISVAHSERRKRISPFRFPFCFIIFLFGHIFFLSDTSFIFVVDVFSRKEKRLKCI